MGAYQSTLAGWVVVIGLVAFVARSNWQKSRTTQPTRIEAPRGRQERPVEKAAKPKEPKQKAKKQAKAAPAPAPAPAAAVAPAVAAPKSKPYNSPSSDDDRASDLEFARQLANVKQGTKFVGKAKDESRQKTVKQSRADEARISAPSSTAGIDADDDRSSAAPSPALGPTEAGNVDDMLETTAPGPTILRLTGTEEKAPAKSQKPKATPEPAESKKQRQNRQKADLAKAQREVAEAERKVKLEKQRRIAREAEGRAAKDGSAFMAAQAVKNNAWTESNGTAPAAVQPLDTFVAKPTPAAEPKAAAPKSVSASFDKNEEWMSSLPSEEEQIQMLREEESWSTVKTKARKTKKQDKENTPVEAAAAAAPKADASAAAPAAALAPHKVRPAVATKSSFDVLKVDATPEDQEETEWDV
ncbi:hypothetical protein F503_08590 [Ophiostoma piceae UAMH 11346]|uniref:Uncharacterized protein n=1 Tax=Ophiostoma piceae (strain UAMH 11346) TaxID=1262450 RepID=S3C7W7_OPHP1|nr:hypothetical protein F503_08590 [Ophiostoma piceae UAMH 11346]